MHTHMPQQSSNQLPVPLHALPLRHIPKGLLMQLSPGAMREWRKLLPMAAPGSRRMSLMSLFRMMDDERFNRPYVITYNCRKIRLDHRK